MYSKRQMHQQQCINNNNANKNNTNFLRKFSKSVCNGSKLKYNPTTHHPHGSVHSKQGPIFKTHKAIENVITTKKARTEINFTCSGKIKQLTNCITTTVLQDKSTSFSTLYHQYTSKCMLSSNLAQCDSINIHDL